MSRSLPLSSDTLAKAFSEPAAPEDPLLSVATVWYAAVTSVLSVGRYHLERYDARGSESGRRSRRCCG